jgi:hypothetical protein
MVGIRVAVADAASAHGLLRRLAALVDRASVSFDGLRNEVRVHKAYEANRSAAVAPSISHRGRTAPRGGPQRDVTHGCTRPHARSSGIPRMVPIASVF